MEDCGINQAIVKVGSVLKELSGTGKALLGTQTRETIDVKCGENILVHAPWFLTAEVGEAPREDEGKNIIRIDEMLMKKGRISVGVDVWIHKYPLSDDEERRRD